MTDFKKVSTGTVFSETQYYTVKKIVGDKIQLENEAGEDIVVDKGYVESCLISADQVEKEGTINKTQAAEIFISNPSVVMEVSYQKQTKVTDVTKEITEAYENSTPKEFATKMVKAVKKGLDGEERVIIGRHSGNQDGFGRYHFIDMKIAKDKTKTYDVRQRLVDPRTINYIKVRGTKYNVK